VADIRFDTIGYWLEVKLGRLSKYAVALLFALSFPAATLAGQDEYDNQYCHDPAEIAKWEKMLAEAPGDTGLHALHALWVGLCLKVEYRQLTTSQANMIFDHAREAIIATAEDRSQQPRKDSF
jgi:hypothetical protein